MDAGVARMKTIFVWSTPRSISTAFERCFKDRPDFSVVHEPFAECYHYGPDRKSSRYGDVDTQDSHTVKNAMKSISEHKLTGHVLVKDLCFQAEPYVSETCLREWENAILLRHPYSVARSLVSLKPDFNEEEFGFTAMRRVIEKLGYIPPVVEGDKFCRSTATVLRKFCSILGVPYLDGYQFWDSGEVRNWTPEEYVAHSRWHKRLHGSKGIERSSSRPSRRDVDRLGLNTQQLKAVDDAVDLFNEIAHHAL